MTIPICRVLYRKETWEEKLLQAVSKGNDLRNIWVSHFRLRKALSTHLLRIHNPNDIHSPCCCVGPSRTLSETAAPAAKKRGCRSSCRRVGARGGAALIPKRRPGRLSASLVVAKEEKRAAMRIEQGTGLVDLRHFHLRYRWSICADADQLAVWGGRDATPVSCVGDWIGELEEHRTVPCGSRVCACFVLCNAVVAKLESPAGRKWL